MKKYLILILFLLYSCSGYSPIYSKKELNFKFDKINIEKPNFINSRIKQKLGKYSSSKTIGSKNLIINLNGKFEKEITSKDKKGNPDSFKIILSLNSKISNQDGEEYSINFEESFNYNKGDRTEFELLEYENILKNNLIDVSVDSLIREIISDI
tara:strand:+ start:1398 stop:1859 length:462 start_codon:yes stop_codon:yes gene_type:complete